MTPGTLGQFLQFKQGLDRLTQAKPQLGAFDLQRVRKPEFFWCDFQL
jgi:hypothetical protein